ncbi:MAG: DMT family transporter, partial [Desulfobacteraceae bacterium]|nr:DMT family transporter [Desulfobacteraceae bacterium]
MDNKKHIHIFYAILAALLFGLNIPLSKILIQTIPPLMMAALLYLGAGLGMLIVDIGNRAFFSKTREARLSGSDLPFIILMVLLDIAAPILLMTGLLMTSAANAALLGNFEIAATAMIAMIIFKENTGKRLWAAIFLITLS